MKPVVLAGGSGSRLWPKSRVALPKQFLSLTSSSSMLQETISRLDGLEASAPIIVCNESHRFLAAEQLRQKGMNHAGILLEPVGRNTAPAIALAALHATANGEDPILLVLAADHLIKGNDKFHRAINKAQNLAENGMLVTFGVVPEQAHNGYGYIKVGQKINDGYNLEKFIEKPSLEAAEQYLAAGDYYWNSGMFMFKASRYLEELERYDNEMLQICKEAIETETPDLEFIRVDHDVFARCREDSIDYAVMEKTERAAMVPLDTSWSDVGSWTSLWETSKKDEKGNVVVGDTIIENTQGSYVNAEDRLVAVLGLDDVVVIETKDAVMVAHKNASQSVKNVVSQLKTEKRPEFEFHREVFRPWGSYDSIDNGDRFQVKRISVKPGEKLSVQMHHHRAEHWIVVSGSANVTINDETQLVTENQSVYIPIGAVHALENPGKIPLELIEVQSGAYLGEDDIVRFSDRYGRVES